MNGKEGQGVREMARKTPLWPCEALERMLLPSVGFELLGSLDVDDPAEVPAHVVQARNVTDLRVAPRALTSLRVNSIDHQAAALFSGGLAPFAGHLNRGSDRSVVGVAAVLLEGFCEVHGVLLSLKCSTNAESLYECAGAGALGAARPRLHPKLG